MRMPACYSVAFRVLRELRLARPELMPSTLLDFGAGPGTVVWAAQEVIHCLHVMLAHAACSREHVPTRSAAEVQTVSPLAPVQYV